MQLGSFDLHQSQGNITLQTRTAFHPSLISDHMLAFYQNACTSHELIFNRSSWERRQVVVTADRNVLRESTAAKCAISRKTETTEVVNFSRVFSDESESGNRSFFFKIFFVVVILPDPVHRCVGQEVTIVPYLSQSLDPPIQSFADVCSLSYEYWTFVNRARSTWATLALRYTLNF